MLLNAPVIMTQELVEEEIQLLDLATVWHNEGFSNILELLGQRIENLKFKEYGARL